MKKKKLTFKKIKKNLAFTLVELLVVISIMGILTILVASSFKTVQVKARDAKRKSDLDSVSKALNIYFTDYGYFPLVESIDFVDGSELADGSIIYMKEIPVEQRDDVEPYIYKLYSGNTDRKSFRLFAELENEDDNDCLDSALCVDYTISGDTCCYGVSSSNIGMDGDML